LAEVNTIQEIEKVNCFDCRVQPDMKIGTIEVEGTGLTAGQPPVIISGKMKQGTVCAVNGLLSQDSTTGEFEAYDFDALGITAACVALETITESTGAAKVLLHGTFAGDQTVKADGSSTTAAELAAVQANSQIYFV
jgi:hypothetical protein